MRVLFHKTFEKQLKKLRPKEIKRTKERIAVFVTEPFHPALHNHALKGKYQGLRSINISGDLRAVYDLVEKDTALFVSVDSHSNLYK